MNNLLYTIILYNYYIQFIIKNISNEIRKWTATTTILRAEHAREVNDWNPALPHSTPQQNWEKYKNHPLSCPLQMVQVPGHDPRGFCKNWPEPAHPWNINGTKEFHNTQGMNLCPCAYVFLYCTPLWQVDVGMATFNICLNYQYLLGVLIDILISVRHIKGETLEQN